MGSTMPEVLHDLSPRLIIYKDGSVQRLAGDEIVPPSQDPKSQVLSKDVVYSQEKNLSSRLFLPSKIGSDEKLPLLLYFHGGGFCGHSPFSPLYHSYLETLVAEAKIMAISVHYRRAPEHPIPIPYDDSWIAVKWAAAHVNGDGQEDWPNSHADFNRVFFAGDSAGANIAHHMALRYGQEKLPGFNVVGTILVHPFFWGKEPIGNEVSDNGRVLTRKAVDAFWHIACPTTSGCDDPLVNPVNDPQLPSLGGSKVLLFVAGNDVLRDRGWLYYKTLKNRGWGGGIKILETKEEDHCFHLTNPTSDNAMAMLQKIVSFMHEDN